MDHQMRRVVEGLADDIGTPVAMTVKSLVQSSEWTKLQQLRCVPSDYKDSESFWKDNLIVELLRKCDLPSSVDKEAAAVETFLACERQNAQTNARLSRFLPESLLIEPEDEPVYRFINEWRKELSWVIGDLPDHITPRFSSGATFADTGVLTTTPDKMSSTPTIYSSARCLLPLWGDTAWSRALVRGRHWQSDPRTVRGNIFFTVPKDGTKFRGCCKEASIAIAYQLDVGRIWKNRLLRIGIDLRQGKAINVALARAASIDGKSATIDMSNASDTLCRVLPKLVVKRSWWELLDSLRAPMTRVGRRWYRLKKFSSMGNGFTFELESALFATMARTVIRSAGGDPDLVKCYGDDLIVPVDHYRDVVAALRLFGFTPNMKKTFAEGPFRESCGGDFFEGVPVRAHYLESLPDEPQHWISLANGLRRAAGGDDLHLSRWEIVRRTWHRAQDPIPIHIRDCRGPSHLGDIVIHDEPDRWRRSQNAPKFRRETEVREGGKRVKIEICEDADDSWNSFYIRAYLPVPKVLPWHHWSSHVQLASCTLGIPSLGVIPRKSGKEIVTGYRVGLVDARLTNSWLPRPMSYGT